MIIKNIRGILDKIEAIKMKLLMIYADEFNYKTSNKTLDMVEEYQQSRLVKDTLVGFIQVEKEDEEQMEKVETKLVKNLKWAAKKNNTNNIVLHSFAHLSLSKAEPKVTIKIFNNAEQRLADAGYCASQTPFGYFLDLDLKAPGRSLARVFKEF